MSSNLVIVESPGKVRTIKKYLGKDYTVKSSVGHIRDLGGGKGNRWTRVSKFDRMGIDPEDDWRAEYVVSKGKEKVVAELKKAAKSSDRIYLATDLDREGEAIAWHLQEVLGGDESKYIRVVFNEITKVAIERAFEEPGKVDLNRVNAQQARRFLDRVVGFELSPLLWKKVASKLSAGRVQSVAVRLVVEREQEIRAFTPEEYWELAADLNHQASSTHHRFQVRSYDGSAFKFQARNETQAEEFAAELQSSDASVLKRDSKTQQSRPNPPFITTTLQRTASSRLGFSPSRTMSIAQRLYEGGHITYMRTDSTNVADEAIASAREFIGSLPVPKGDDSYMPSKPNTFKSKKASQEAHEAIRPTEVGTTPIPKSISQADEKRLYELIWRRFIASQMTPARTRIDTVTVGAGKFELSASATHTEFEGHQHILPPQGRSKTAGEGDDERLELPAEYQVGVRLNIGEVHKTQRFTKPAGRYSQAGLIAELEKRGIGRPSTYAGIIRTIEERGYVSKVGRTLFAEKIGEVVTERLLEHFDELMDYDFTSRMESDLDRVAVGELQWKDTLNSFYGKFQSHLVSAENDLKKLEAAKAGLECDKCGRDMLLRLASSGMFLGCEAFSLKKDEQCKNTRSLSLVIPEDDSEESIANYERSLKRCEKCGGTMEQNVVDKSTKVHICGNYPTCSTLLIEKGEFEIPGAGGPTIECDKCGADMEHTKGRFGPYYSCTSDSCKNTRKILRNGDVAPPKADPVQMPELKVEGMDDHYVLRDGASGIFLAASKFPRIRKTRNVLVSELKPHGNELDRKFRFLLEAPVSNDDGVPYVVRFSRKTKKHYLSAEKDNKRTGWVSHFDDGKWIQHAPKGKNSRG